MTEDIYPPSKRDKRFYLFYAKDLIDHAFKEFARYTRTKDEVYLIQASEKAWNALVQLGFAYGKPSGHHNETTNQIKTIRSNVPNEALEFAKMGEKLHANFYHNFITPEFLENDMEKIRDFVNKKIKEEGYVLRGGRR
jgi:hypothetical protein